MDLFTIAGACLRRWYITLPLLLLVGFFSYRAYAAVDPLYTSSRSIVVLPSLEQQAAANAAEEEQEALPDDDDNPYSGQGGSRFAVAVLARNINSTAFEERLGLGEDVEQTFEADTSNEQPMIHIDATAPSEQRVYDLLDSVVDESGTVLDEFQAEAGAPEVTRYRIAPAVPEGPVEDATPSRLRAAGAIAVLGGGLVAAVVVGVDALLIGRRRRRDEVAAAPIDRDPTPGPGGEREDGADEVGPPVPVGAADGTGPSADDAGGGARTHEDAPTRPEHADQDRVSATARD